MSMACYLCLLCPFPKYSMTDRNSTFLPSDHESISQVPYFCHWYHCSFSLYSDLSSGFSVTLRFLNYCYFNLHCTWKLNFFFLSGVLRQAQWHVPIISAFGKLRQEDCESEASLGFIENSAVPWTLMRPYLQTPPTHWSM